MKNRLLNLLSRTSSEIPAKDASITESESSMPGWNKINWKGVSANYKDNVTEEDTNRSGYTASNMRCCSIFVPSKKLTEAS